MGNSVDAATEALVGSASRAPLTDGVLLATHGTMDSDAAARVARAFTARRGAPLAALGVLTPLPTPSPEVDAQREIWLTDCITEQLGCAAADDAQIVVEIGDVAEVVVREATARGASLIALGLTPHRVVDRLLSADLAIRILHRGDVPVLAVAPSAKGLMDTIVIATDFSPTATRMTNLALAFASAGAAVHLVHVCALLDYLPGGGGRHRLYETGAYTLLDRFNETLSLPPRAQVWRHVLRGEPDQAIRTLAAEQYADLIAVGSHGRGLPDRVIVASIAESVLRHADCSVLIVQDTGAKAQPCS